MDSRHFTEELMGFVLGNLTIQVLEPLRCEFSIEWVMINKLRDMNREKGKDDASKGDR